MLKRKRAKTFANYGNLIFPLFGILEAAFNFVYLLPFAYIPYTTFLLLSGILAQNTGPFMNKTFGPTYIAASYIKFIESAGGRVVPIKYPLKNVKFRFKQVAKGKKIHREEITKLTFRALYPVVRTRDEGLTLETSAS